MLFVELSGVFMLCKTVSTVTDLLNGLNARSVIFNTKIDQLLEYFDDKSTSQELRMRVTQYFSFLHSSSSSTMGVSTVGEGEDGEGFWKILSGGLREELMISTYYRHLWTIPFLEATAKTGVITTQLVSHCPTPRTGAVPRGWLCLLTAAAADCGAWLWHQQLGRGRSSVSSLSLLSRCIRLRWHLQI